MRRNNEVQAADVATFRNKALACVGMVIMPASLRFQIVQAVSAVELPLRLVMHCKSTREKWEIYKGRIRSAILPLLDKSPEGDRITADIQRRINNERY